MRNTAQLKLFDVHAEWLAWMMAPISSIIPVNGILGSFSFFLSLSTEVLELNLSKTQYKC